MSRDPILHEIDMIEYDLRSISPKASNYGKLVARRAKLLATLHKI